MNRIYRAFFYTLDGLRWAAAHEAAVRQELFVLALAVPVSFVVAAHWWQVPLLIGAVVFVLMVEMLNTGLEKLCDHVRIENHPDIKVIKDVGSAACFLAQSLGGVTWLTVLGQRVFG